MVPIENAMADFVGLVPAKLWDWERVIEQDYFPVGYVQGLDVELSDSVEKKCRATEYLLDAYGDTAHCLSNKPAFARGVKLLIQFQKLTNHRQVERGLRHAEPPQNLLDLVVDGSSGSGFEPRSDHYDTDRKSTRLNSSHLVISYAA